MCSQTVLALFFSLLVPVLSQSNTSADTGGLPRKPYDILMSAAPLYDFSSQEVKPWHLKVSYQIYNWNGQQEEQGTWEYWQRSAAVSRTDWSRPGSEHTVWQTTGGAIYRKDSGSTLRYLEKSIPANFLHPLRSKGIDDFRKMKLEVKMLPPGKPELACVVDESARPVPDYFCFDPITPALRMTVSDGVTTLFSQIVKTQGRYLGRQIEISGNKRKLFTASVSTIELADPGDAAFKPNPDATLLPVSVGNYGGGSSGFTPAKIAKKVSPDDPQLSKPGLEKGVVSLGIVVNMEGKVQDVEILTAPSPRLADAAVGAVKKWEYKPALVNGVPIEFSAIVHVIFGSGG